MRKTFTLTAVAALLAAGTVAAQPVASEAPASRDAYAVTTLTKVASLPDLPTADSAGLKGFEVAVWHGLYAPKGTPAPVVAKLNTALKAALKDQNVIQRFADLGTEPVPEAKVDPATHQAFLKAEIDKWSPVIKAAGEYAD